MQSFKQRKEEIQKVLDNCITLCKDAELNVACQKLTEFKNSYSSRELKIVVVGEARRGKSTLLNALLNLDEQETVFPIDIAVCTNVVTVVRYGETEEIKVVYADRKTLTGLNQKSIRRDEIKDYVTENGNSGNYKMVRRLEIAMPNDFLKEGIVIVDTPGVGSLNAEHAEVTYAYLPDADIMLFVGDAASGFTDTELNLLKRGYKFCKNVISPLTKIDLVENYEVVLEDNRKKISDTLGLPMYAVQVVPVSSRAKMDYLFYQDEELLKISNFYELEKCIWDKVSEIKSEVFFCDYLEKAKAIMMEQLEREAAHYQLIASGNKDMMEEMTEKLKESKKQLDKLRSDSPQWQSDLGIFFSNLGIDINAAVNHMSSELATQVDDYFRSQDKSCCEESNYNRKLAEINDEMALFCIDNQNIINEKVDVQVEKIHKQLMLDSFGVGSIISSIGFEPINSLPVTLPERTMMDKFLNAGRTAKMGMLGGTVGGGFIGGLLGGVLGMFAGGPAAALAAAQIGMQWGGTLGTAAGAGYSVKEAMNKSDPQSINILKVALKSYVSEAKTDIQASCQKYLNEVRTVTIDNFKNTLKDKSDELNEQIRSYGASLKASQTEKAEELKKIQSQHTKFETVIKIIDEDLKSIRSEPKPIYASTFNTKKTSMAVDKERKNNDTNYDFLSF